MTKQIIVTGANGQLGTVFQKKSLKIPFFWTFVSRNDLDIANKEEVKNFLAKKKANFLINTAAYTKVDLAEEEKEQCLLVNHIGVQNLAEVCKEQNIPLIHFSTDYVFDGTENEPYTTEHPPSPINHYGKSKWLGEQEIQKRMKDYIILRVSWLYTNGGNNFVEKMRELFQKKSSLKVVSDQRGCPTYTDDLADFVIYLLTHWESKKERGIYHFCNQGVTSWYDFAKEIQKYTNDDCEIFPCTTEDFPTLAQRPKYSVLDTSKIKEDFDYSIRSWQEALADYFKNDK